MSAEAELASVMTDYYREIDLYVAATALCCYDYGLTLPDEIQYIWKSKLSFVSALFYAFRIGKMTSCAILVRIDMAMNVLLMTSATLFASLRVYAISDRRKLTCALTFISGMVFPVVSFYTYIRTSPLEIVYPARECGIRLKIPDKTYAVWIIGARVASLCSDAIVMIVTWMKTKSMAISVQNFSNNTLSKVLVQDTGLYFALLSIANIIGIVLGQYTEIVDPISMVMGSLTSIVMSRLLIDLRKVVSSHPMDGSLSATLKTIAFADGRQDESLEDDFQEHDIACSSDAAAADRHEDYHGDHATAEIDV